MKTTDIDLIHRILDGDDTAFTELVEKYQKPVHALVWRKIGDFHIAEEITQDTFLKVYQELKTLKKPHSFASWLYVIAANKCSTWLRNKRPMPESLEDTSIAQLDKPTYSRYVISEKERIAVESQREAVEKLLEKLQESDRTIITLYYFGEMSSAEIGAFLGVSANTVRSRLRRAQQRLKKDETMIREALEHFKISPNLTDNIIQEISQSKQVAPTSGKPFIPWAVGVTALTIVLLMLGFSNQYLSRFQKPYNFNAASEMKVELIDTPIVQNLESDPDDRTQLGKANAQGVNNGSDQPVNNAGPVDLETIITKMKHYEKSVVSVTGDFVMETYKGMEIAKDEYKLTFAGDKVRIERKKREFVNLPLVEYWDGKQQWGVYKPDNPLFKVEISPNKESTTLEKVQLAFNKVGIKITEGANIVSGDLANSYKVSDKDKTYFVLFVGDTTLEVYGSNVGYSVRPKWVIDPDIDPRFWLTYPRGSDNSYLSEPLWHLLEKYESELIGSEILNGEMTSVIHLTKPARIIGEHEIPSIHLKLWISHNIGFRLVKLERTYNTDDESQIHIREIDYHEYLPNVWFPKRIERTIAPVKLPGQQVIDDTMIHKTILLTKQCKVNTDVSRLLRLDLSTDTPVFDYKEFHQITIGDLEVKPNFQIQLNKSNIPSRKSELKQPISDSTSQETLKWHLPEGAKARHGKGHIKGIAYSPDGTLLAVVSSIGIWLYDAHTGQELDLLIRTSVQVKSVAFSPDGKTLVSGNSDNTIHLWDIQTHTLQNTFKGHTDSVLSVVFNSDGTSLASGSKDNTICLWDVYTGKLQKTLKGHTNAVISVVFDPNGETLASGGIDTTLRLWDVETGTLQKTINLVEYTERMDMTFSPDGKTLAAWEWGTIQLWDVGTGVLEKTLKEQERDVVYDIAFNPDGKTIASAMNNGTIRLWHTQTWEQQKILIGHKNLVLSVVYSSDGKTLTSAGFDGTLRRWDLETGECQNTHTGFNGDVNDVAYSSDGKTIASALDNGTVDLLNAQTGMLLHTLKVLNTDSDLIKSVSFSPDGKMLAGGGYGREIHLWDVETGERQNTLNGHDTVSSVAFSADGKTLASASWDTNTIRLLDTETGTIRHTFEEHTDGVNSVALVQMEKRS
ncbi:sigma-70 family RNA polymerase sigma factor [Candidatus Poribacteria bacterium]|nr:sigma-70 family RNA polymerase sigma factor [Candidatus Poribacteria bacterium]